jgi:phosphomannomutase
MQVASKPIKFGTDGWRGIIGDDFTFERLVLVAPIVARVLSQTYGDTVSNNTVIVGYDRRFMAEVFAQRAAEAVMAAGFDVLLAEMYAPTPAFSWAVKHHNALGALVITASHNPGSYLGLKIKGAFGGSVPPEVTRQVEALLAEHVPLKLTLNGKLETFDPWPHYCETLRSKVDIAEIQAALAQGKLTVFADVMHGAAAGGLAQLLGAPVQEINSVRDPLFGGNPPEPLPCYLSHLFQLIQKHRCTHGTDTLAVGLVFDGDADRIAAVDGQGNFLSPQVLVPVLIDHLAARRGLTGEVVKTVSGSDLIPRVAALYQLPVHETPIGFKYIADRMLTTKVLLGGEESGGIGYANCIPERDGLLSALYLLEAIAKSKMDLSELYRRLQEKTGFTSTYERIDLPLTSMDERSRLLEQLQTKLFKEIAGFPVVDCLTIDGYKFRLADNSWLMIRFSGTEPVLRFYCEAPSPQQVRHLLNWAKNWATER